METSAQVEEKRGRRKKKYHERRVRKRRKKKKQGKQMKGRKEGKNDKKKQDEREDELKMTQEEDEEKRGIQEKTTGEREKLKKRREELKMKQKAEDSCRTCLSPAPKFFIDAFITKKGKDTEGGQRRRWKSKTRADVFFYVGSNVILMHLRMKKPKFCSVFALILCITSFRGSLDLLSAFFLLGTCTQRKEGYIHTLLYSHIQSQ